MPFNHTQNLTTNLKNIESHNLESASNVIHLRTAVTESPIVVGPGDHALTPNEQEWLHDAVLKHEQHSPTTLNRLGENSHLKPNVLGWDRAGAFDLGVVLTIWEGRGPPPKGLTELDWDKAAEFEDNSAGDGNPEFDDDGVTDEKQIITSADQIAQLVPFKQSPLTSGHESCLRWRWSRAHSTPILANKDEWRSWLGRILRNLATAGIENVRMYYVPMEIIAEPLQLRQAFDMIDCADNLLGNPSIKGLPLAEFQKFAGKASTVQFDNGIALSYLERSNPISIGSMVEVATSRRFTVLPGHDKDLIASSKFSSDVLIHQDIFTLAEFVREHCHSRIIDLGAPGALGLLTSMLRGVEVSVSAGKDHETRAIVGLSAGKYSDLPKQELHYTFSAWGGSTYDSMLPCVNVGSIEKPSFVSMEMCHLLKKQRLRGPRDVSFNLRIKAVKHEELQRSAFAGHQDPGLIYTHQQPDKQKDNHDSALFEACDGSFPNLLFIQAGSGPLNSQRWLKLRNVIEDKLLEFLNNYITRHPKATGKPVPAKHGELLPLLSLHHDRHSDQTAIWTRRLKDLVAAN